MTAPVRYPSGVTNVTPRDPLYMFPQTDPTRLIMYHNDFHTYTAGDWTVTETAAGATQAVNAGAAGGILELTGSAAGFATDVTQIQLANETFKFVAGKQLWLKTRFAATATLANFGVLAGLAITDTTATAGVSDGIFFRKPSGGTALSAVICKNSTESTVAMGTMTSGTYVTCAMHYDGRGTIGVWLDNAKVGTFTDLTNMVDDEELTVTLASVNATAAAANVLSVDYILAAIER